jgi:putative FmdB family regulatory protein
MPIFDYSCEACGHNFDVLQKLGADPLKECPECGKHELKKCVSAPAFHLKGKGWRNSDDTPKKPDVRPRFGHTLDSPVAHAEHSHDGPAKSDGHSHGGGDAHGKEHGKEHDKGHSHSPDHSHGHSHGHEESGGGVGRIVREHVKSPNHDKGHGHSHDHSQPSGGKHKHDH